MPRSSAPLSAELGEGGTKQIKFVVVIVSHLRPLRSYVFSYFCESIQKVGTPLKHLILLV